MSAGSVPRARGPWLERLRLRLDRALIPLLPGPGRLCPVCGSTSHRFQRFGDPPRADARCPRCGALERHRLFWLCATKRTRLLDGSPWRVLHVAPEACLETRLRRLLGAGYVGADRAGGRAAVTLDVTDLPFPDRSFDVILCVHVLEHVPDDRRALREFHRILADAGWALLSVPIEEGATSENPSLAEPRARRDAFGQEDHVRRCGPDYAERIRQAGFAVEVLSARDLAGAEEVARLGLSVTTARVHVCTKPGS